jgi:hypothetical protein
MPTSEIQPYRKPPPVVPAPATELFVPWENTEGRATPMRLFLGLLIGGSVVSVAAMVTPALSALLGAALLVWAVTTWRSARGPSGVRLRVEDGALWVDRGRGQPPERFPLSGLRNVEIESKALQRVVLEQQVGAPMMTTAVTPSVDVGRLALVSERAPRPVYLLETFGSYSHCTEWLGKVRVFLRRGGWVPEDEREGAPGA